MERKFLDELGLDKEAIDKIMAENGRDIEAQKAASAAKAQELEAANGTIRELRAAVRRFDGKNPDELEARLSELQKQYDADLSKTRLDAALDLALAAGKAKNIKAARALLDMDAVKFEDGTLMGLDAQLERLRESDGYLFEDAGAAQNSPPPRISSGPAHGSPPAADPMAAFVASARSAAGLKTD